MARIISSGNTLFSPENYEKKRRKRNRKLFLFSTGALILLIILIVVSRIERLLISTIDVEGARVITEEEIVANVTQTLSQKYFWLVPKANAALYPRNTVKENLIKEFPRISSVTLTLSSPKSLSVSVNERDPFALYCPEEPEKCFFVDDEGFIFDEAPDFSGVVYFVHRKSESIEEPKGKSFMPPEEFQVLSAFIDGVGKLGFTPVSAKDTELTMRNGSRLLWQRELDYALLLSNLEAFLNSPEIKRDEKFIDKVKVLDLRTENKVFYRFNDQ